MRSLRGVEKRAEQEKIKSAAEWTDMLEKVRNSLPDAKTCDQGGTLSSLDTVAHGRAP